MEKFLNKRNLFLLILLVGFLVRFFKLGQVPASMNRDEPAIGYNAYSILKTGRDEWGVKFPLNFKSFGDYKSPLYIYLTTLPIAAFGLNEFSVRFWSAISGFLLIIISFKLTKKIFKNDNFGLAVAFLLAIMSWQLFFSRFSFEANLGLLLNTMALYFLLENNFNSINFKALIFILFSFLAYSSSLIIWPLFLIIWLCYIILKTFQQEFYRVNLTKILKISLYFLFLLFVFWKLTATTKQKAGITVFKTPQIQLDFNRARIFFERKFPFLPRSLYNKYFYFGRIIFVNYLKNFSWNFLFGGGGGHPWHKTPQSPHFYPILSILIIIGLVYFLKYKEINKKNKLFLLLYFLISSIPSAITTDAPHATRSLNYFLILTIFAGAGLGWLIKRNKLISTLVFIVIFINLFGFLNNYFVSFSCFPNIDFLPGLKEVNNYLKDNSKTADRIIFDNFNDGGYAYLLFYNAYPPQDFQQKVKRYGADVAGLEWVERLDKYVFVDRPVPDDNYKEIYVLKDSRSLNKNILFQAKNPKNGQLYYQVEANY